MIRFKCIYCGQRILAPDDGFGKKGKCPKCNHILVVPGITAGRPAISPDKEPMPEPPRKYVPAWDKDRITYMTDEGADALIELCRESFGFLVPTYDELSLFLTAVTFIVLFAVNANVRELIFSGITSFNIGLCILLVILLGGIILSLCHIFVAMEKNRFEKAVMMVFVVMANAITGIMAGWYVMKNSNACDWRLIFPIWNLVNGVFLLLMLFFNIVNEECVSDRHATPAQIIFGLTAVFIIFAICNYVFKFYWAITFSVCVIYTTSFDRALQNVLPGLMYREDEQTQQSDKVNCL